MNRAGRIALGCLLAPIGLLTLLVLLFAGIRLAGVPEYSPATRELEQALPSSPPTPRAPQEAPSATTTLEGHGDAGSSSADERPLPQLIPPGESVRVVLDLEEGEFTIFPGPAEEGIKVDADYDQGSYELQQSYGHDGNRPVYHLRFRSKVSFLRRIAQDGSFDDEDMSHNRIRVQLPRDVPMELLMALAKSESDIDLSGLSLVASAQRYRMGQVELRVDEPNPLPMDTFSVDASMGETRMRGISYLGAKRITARGSMGEMRLDLGGPLQNDTDLQLGWKMGEIRLLIPDNARVVEDSRASAALGEVDGDLLADQPDDPEAPQLRIGASILLGNFTVDRYRAHVGPTPPPH